MGGATNTGRFPIRKTILQITRAYLYTNYLVCKVKLDVAARRGSGRNSLNHVERAALLINTAFLSQQDSRLFSL